MPSHGNDSQHENCATSRLEISRNDSEIKWKDRLLLGLTTFGSAQRCRTLIGHWWATSQSGVGNVEFLLAQPIFFFWGRRSWGLGSKKKEKERKKKKKKSEENSDSFDPSLFNRIGCNRWRRAPPPKEMSCQSDTDTHTHEKKQENRNATVFIICRWFIDWIVRWRGGAWRWIGWRLSTSTSSHSIIGGRAAKRFPIVGVVDRSNRSPRRLAFFSRRHHHYRRRKPPQLKRKENTETRRPSWKTRKEASSWDAKARTWLVGMERSFNRAPIASFASVISTFALKFHSILMTEEFDWSPRNAKRLRAGTRKLERDWLEWSDHSTGLLFPPSL